jgi:hypothetical protein
VLLTSHPAEPFEEFTRYHPPVSKAKQVTGRARKAQIPSDVRERLLADNPWLTEDDFGKARPTKKRRPTGPRSPRRAATSSESEEAPRVHVALKAVKVVEVDVADVRAELEALRHEDAWEPEGVDVDEEELQFYVHIRGGKWTKENKGVVADGVAAYARKGCATDWCQVYKFPRQVSFMYNKFGRDVANSLAREYVRRAQFFFVQWYSGVDDMLVYQPHHLAAYEEGLEWLEFIASLDAHGVAFKRALEIRALVPQNV